MSKRLFVVAVVFISTAITQVTALQRPAGAPNRVDTPPRVVIARHDRSPDLRDIPIGEPPAIDRAEREPPTHRIARHASNLLSDPVVQTTQPPVTAMSAPTRSIEGIGNVN